MATKHLGKYDEYRTQARSSRPVRLGGSLSKSTDDPLGLSVESGPDEPVGVSDAVRLRLANVVVPAWLKKIKPLELALDTMLVESPSLILIAYRWFYLFTGLFSDLWVQ